MQYKCKVVTQAQILNSVLLKLCISTCKIFQRLHVYKLHLPYALLQLCCLWKIYLCLLTPNCFEKLLPEQDSFKMLYGLHAAAWISIAKISFCGLWTISDNECKFQGNFHWLFEAFSYKFSLNILLNLSPPKFVIMYFACFLKNAVDSFSLPGPQWLFQWINILAHHNLFCFNRSPKACNEYTPIVFISSGPLSGKPVPFSQWLLYITIMVTGQSSFLLFFMKGNKTNYILSSLRQSQPPWPVVQEEAL